MFLHEEQSTSFYCFSIPNFQFQILQKKEVEESKAFQTEIV